MANDDLDRFFAAARAARPEPSPALMARVVADAAAVQASRMKRPAPRRASWLSRLAPAFGAGGAWAGLAAASAAGFWIGTLEPGLVGAVWPADAAAVELIPSLDGVLADAGE